MIKLTISKAIVVRLGVRNSNVVSFSVKDIIARPSILNCLTSAEIGKLMRVGHFGNIEQQCDFCVF
jgi:hypothetical protein